MTIKIHLYYIKIIISLQAGEFCDAENHNGTLHTKQNVLCDERSIWDVMQMHADFQQAKIKRSIGDTLDDNNLPLAEMSTESMPADSERPQHHQSQVDAFSAPKFQYFLPAAARYVLVLDRSKTMADSVRIVTIINFNSDA